MILHLGSECFVSANSVIMILDYKEAVKNQDTSLFLKGMETEYVSDTEKPCSAVITGNDGRYRVYLSPISLQTLYKRSKTPFKEYAET